jgi:hypothetical protein
MTSDSYPSRRRRAAERAAPSGRPGQRCNHSARPCKDALRPMVLPSSRYIAEAMARRIAAQGNVNPIGRRNPSQIGVRLPVRTAAPRGHPNGRCRIGGTGRSSWPTRDARAGMSSSMSTPARGDRGGDSRAAAGPGDHPLGMQATSASRRRSRRPRCCRNSRSPPRTPRPPVDSRRGHSCCRRRSPGSQQSRSNIRPRSRTSLAGPYRSSWSRRVCSPGGCLCGSASCSAWRPCAPSACSGGCLGRTAAPRPLGQPPPRPSPSPPAPSLAGLGRRHSPATTSWVVTATCSPSPAMQTP